MRYICQWIRKSIYTPPTAVQKHMYMCEYAWLNVRQTRNPQDNLAICHPSARRFAAGKRFVTTNSTLCAMRLTANSFACTHTHTHALSKFHWKPKRVERGGLAQCPAWKCVILRNIQFTYFNISISYNCVHFEAHMHCMPQWVCGRMCVQITCIQIYIYTSVYISKPFWFWQLNSRARTPPWMYICVRMYVYLYTHKLSILMLCLLCWTLLKRIFSVYLRKHIYVLVHS